MKFTPEEIRQRRNARLKAARVADPERFARYERTRRDRHGAKLNAASKVRKARWQAKNPEKVRAQWARDNARRSAERSRALAERYRTDPAHNLIVRLRVRTRKALAGISKSAAIELLGCTPGELRAWLELHFQEDMTWDNMAEWELDHHWPLSLFDLTDPRQLQVACNFRNLRPLFRAANRRKKHHLSPVERAAFDAWKASL